MTLKTRLFGKKIRGEALKTLVKAIGEDPEMHLPERVGISFTTNVYGKSNLIPSDRGIDVDLYIIRALEYHDKDALDFLGFPEPKMRKDLVVTHLTGMIPYSHLNQRNQEAKK